MTNYGQILEYAGTRLPAYGIGGLLSPTPPPPPPALTMPFVVGARSDLSDYPLGTQAGDFCLFVCETANQAITLGGSWTELPNSPRGVGISGAVNATRVTAFAGFWDGVEACPTFNVGILDHEVSAVVAIRGVDPANPYNYTQFGTIHNGFPTIVVAGNTTTTDECLIVFIHSTVSSAANFFSNWSNPDLSALGLTVESTTVVGNGGGIYVASGGKATAGPHGDTTVDTVSVGQTVCCPIALNPVPV